MNFYLSALFFFLLIFLNKEVQATLSLTGSWSYVAIRYNGQIIKKPNPDLNIVYTFLNDNKTKLYWDRKDEAGFCERQGDLQDNGYYFEDTVTWTNPENRFDCHQDPDMQVGKKSTNPYVFRDGYLEIKVLAGDHDFWYVWEKISTE